MSRIRKDTETPAGGYEPELETPKPWSLPPYTPPTPEEVERVRALVREVTGQLGAAALPTRRTPAYLPARCPACADGKFVHQGVRYCLRCYGSAR